MKNKKILLIAFKFPPYPGVGGYRWSKLSKYLARLGYQVHVVTIDWKMTGANTLLEDVQHENIKIHRISSGCPHNLRQKKLGNRYFNYAKNLLLTKVIDQLFFWDDEAQRWGRYLIPFCKQLISKERIKVVIATGHPFQAIRHAVTLKASLPDIKLIADFRDPWIQHPGYQVSIRRYQVAKDWLRFVLKNCNLNVCVTQGLIEQYRPFYPEANFVSIHNGVDTEIVQKLPTAQIEYDFVHVGNISNGREVPCSVFLETMAQIKPDAKVLLVGNMPRKIYEYKKYLSNLSINPPVSQEKAFNFVQMSRYALQFNAEVVPYLLSTKVYEYPALGVPTISINYGGEIEKLILENDWGCSINLCKDSIHDKLRGFLGSPTRAVSFDQKYCYNNIAKAYSNYIEWLLSI